MIPLNESDCKLGEEIKCDSTISNKSIQNTKTLKYVSRDLINICCIFELMLWLNIITCLISYSSFTDNITSGHACISQSQMKCCSIHRNMRGSSNSEATFRFDGNTVVMNLCILMNNATNTSWV
jgi:hypothetical protein